MPLAIITGASRGLGRALARALAQRGWSLVLDARGREDLERVECELSATADVAAIRGDVSDDWHRQLLLEAAGDDVDLLVNNASVLGPSPQPRLAAYPLGELERVYRVNVLAPLALAQLVLRRMPDGGTILNITSDAAVEAYEGWGGYGSSKAARSRSRQPWPVSIRRSGSTRSTPGTCARGCIRRHSPARTYPIGPRPRRACPVCSS